jgi:hypothetical protein
VKPEERPATDRAALPGELGAFLFELSIALHRFAMYPDGHPALARILAALATRTETLLQTRPQLAIGVARDRLVIEGIVTEATHPLLRALAERLHRHHIAALRFGRGLTIEELEGAVAAIAEDPDRGAGALGVRPPDRAPRWPHVSLHALSVDRLEIVRDGAADDGRPLRAADLWIGLAQAALGQEDSPLRPLAMEPAVVARAIDDHQRAEAYDQVVVGYLLQIAEEIRHGADPDTLELRRRVSTLVSSLQPETLRRLVTMGGQSAQRQRFLDNATGGMSAGAVVDLLKAAADGMSETLSSGLLRMLTKLAAHAESGGPRVQPLADSALRVQVARLTSGWALVDPNPSDYTGILSEIARTAPVEIPADVAPSRSPEPQRLLEMCLELGEEGPALWRAVSTVVQRGQVAAALPRIGRSRPNGSLEARVWDRFSSADTVQALLERQPPDFSTIDVILPSLRGDALDPLFDLLLGSDDRHVRRAAFDRLRHTGHEGARQATARLASGPWYTIRNLLALLAEIEMLPEGVAPLPWLAHVDARVRREALRVALRIDACRDAALETGLRDSDPRVVRIALAAARDRCPLRAVSSLRHLAEREELDDGLRALAVEVLACVDKSTETRDLLVRLASRPGGYRRPAMPAEKRTVLAAISGLAEAWPADVEAARLVRAASRSGRAEYRLAARSDA